jgi:hypothetical protein
LENLALRIGACHGHEFRGSVQAHDVVAQRSEVA